MTVHELFRKNPKGYSTFGEFVVDHYAKELCFAEYEMDGKWHKIQQFDECTVKYVCGILDDILAQGSLVYPTQVKLLNSMVVKRYRPIEAQMDSIVVSAAIVDLATKRLFLQQRGGKTTYPWMHCTPGGKVNSGESMLDALRRELYEEHGVLLAPPSTLVNVYVHEVKSTRSGKLVDVHCFAIPIDCVIGEYKCGNNVAGFGWYSWQELSTVNLTPADEANRDKLLKLVQ